MLRRQAVSTPAVFVVRPVLQSGQNRELDKSVGLVYLNRLKKRMQDWGFPPDDPLWLFVCRAENAMHELHVDVYYRSVAGCVMPPKEPPMLGISNRAVEVRGRQQRTQ
jgi:hypothetical protein